VVGKKVVCMISFDYEIFLGRNFGDASWVLFEPTRKILDLCKQLDFSVTFFADVCSVWAHRKYGFDAYADNFEAQLREMVTYGHDVGLHIHPHWLSSVYENGEWQVSTEQMYLHELGFGAHKNSADEIVFKSLNYLNDLLNAVDPQYRCTAFRAAGLALQPQEKELIRVLLDAGILIDSSIAKNLKLNMDIVSIDYSNVPKNANWFMAPETGIEKENSEGVLEIPIGTFQISRRERISFLIRRALSIGKLRGMTLSRTSKQSRLANIHSLAQVNLRYILSNPYFILSCDTKGMTLELLLKGFDYYLGLHDDNQIYLSMINHPKLMFDEEIELLGRFVEAIREKYPQETIFQTFRQASKELGLFNREGRTSCRN